MRVMHAVRVIYGIALAQHPEQVRYIGLTRGTAQDRLRVHLHNARKGRNTKFYAWLKKHMDEELSVVVLEVCTDLSDTEFGDRERYWIRYYRNLQGDCDSGNAHSLLNMSDGGINCSLSGDANHKSMLGKSHTAESNAKRSATLKGRQFTDEHRKKLSDAAKKRTLSQETRDRISVAKKGSIPWNKKVKNDNA